MTFDDESSGEPESVQDDQNGAQGESAGDLEGDVPSRGELINYVAVNAPKPLVLKELERSFVTLMVQHYMLYGNLPSAEAANEEYGFDAQQFKSLINKDVVQKALEEFDVNLGELRKSPDGSVLPTWQHKSLTAQQLLVANVLLDTRDTRSHTKKLKELGVQTRTYNTWLRDVTFSGYLRKRAEDLLGDSQHDVHLALIDQATAGNIKAIEYYNELVGRYIKQPERILGVQQQFDATTFIVQIIEILDDELEDKQAAFRIADRLKELGSRYAVAGQLANPPVGNINRFGATMNEHGIEVPEVVKTRPLDGTLKILTDKGVGMDE